MILDFDQVLSQLLSSRPILRVMVIRPILRTIPSHFKSDLLQLQVPSYRVLSLTEFINAFVLLSAIYEGSGVRFRARFSSLSA